jgi:hypothetical protein
MGGGRTQLADVVGKTVTTLARISAVEGICLKCNVPDNQPTLRLPEIVLPCNSPRR